jgi:hypothetical protein
MHTCRIAVQPNGAHWGTDWSGGGVECGQPATKCIIATQFKDGRGEDDNYTETIWMCEAHWCDHHTRSFFEDVWDKVEY